MAEYDVTKIGIRPCDACGGWGIDEPYYQLTHLRYECKKCRGSKVQEDQLLKERELAAYAAGRTFGLEEAAEVCAEHAEAFEPFSGVDVARLKKQIKLIQEGIRALAQEVTHG